MKRKMVKKRNHIKETEEIHHQLVPPVSKTLLLLWVDNSESV